MKQLVQLLGKEVSEKMKIADCKSL